MCVHVSYRHLSPSQPCSINFISGTLNRHFSSEKSHQPSTLSALAGVAIVAMGFLNLLYRVVLSTEINHSDKMQTAALLLHLIDGDVPALQQRLNSQEKKVKEISFFLSLMCFGLFLGLGRKIIHFHSRQTIHLLHIRITTTMLQLLSITLFLLAQYLLCLFWNKN